MKQIASLHLSQQHLRLLILQTHQNNTSVTQYKSIDLIDKDGTPDLSTLELEQYLHGVSDTCVFTLGGGYYHIQRVPLEVASEADRRAQINWEAGQVLIDPIEDYDIDFFPSGRVAFWTAIRKKITQPYTEFLTNLGFNNIHYVPEPLALYGLSKHTQSKNTQGAIWLGESWGSFVAQNNDALTIAETIYLQHPQNEQRIVAQIKHWIQGDLSTERRRPAFDQVLLCGESKPLAALADPLSDIRMPRITAFDSATSTLTKELESPNSFALSLGAALAHLGPCHE